MGLTNLAGRDVVISSWSHPRWSAVIADTGGRWHLIPFRAGRSTTPTVDASISREFAAGSFASRRSRSLVAQRRRANVTYRYRNGVFVPVVVPLPRCAPRALMALPGIRAHITRSACAYGWALAVGMQKGKRVGLAFSDLDGRGWYHVDTILGGRHISRRLEEQVTTWPARTFLRRALSR
jgi:hypothetical protein